MDRLRLFLWFFGLYLGLAGTITFSMFICEEAIQTATWGTWPAADIKDWKTVRSGIMVIKGINRTLKIINYTVGWIQPLAFVSYRQYGKATDYYIEGLTAKVFANAPELYVGEEVQFNFRPNRSERLADGNCAYRFGKVAVVAECDTKIGQLITVKGVLEEKDEQLVVQP